MPSKDEVWQTEQVTNNRTSRGFAGGGKGEDDSDYNVGPGYPGHPSLGWSQERHEEAEKEKNDRGRSNSKS